MGPGYTPSALRQLAQQLLGKPVVDESGRQIGTVTHVTEDDQGLRYEMVITDTATLKTLNPTPLDLTFAAKAFDVPPWLVDSDYEPPRFPRLRWRLRKVWPL